MEKKRLDVLVFELGYSESREKAKLLIMEGHVYVNGQKADKPGDLYASSSKIEIRGDRLPFVGRGGLKLQKALVSFGLNVCGLICMDVGASTGGFTDCMLQNGAKRIYAVDVGYGQLAWKLRSDPRVVCMERKNIRTITSEQVPEPVDFVSVDVSFISLQMVLPPVRELMREGAYAVCLVKPQFEAGRNRVGKGGIVREASVQIDVLENNTAFFVEHGFSVLGVDYSPIKGAKGNIEYLVLLKKDHCPVRSKDFHIERVVQESHSILNGGEVD